MRTVAIVGVGLIGGSFGLALRSCGFDGEILGVSSEFSLAAAVEKGAIDRGVALSEAAASADLIYLAQPISRILDTLRRLNPWVRSETLVTDAGSTKHVIVDTARKHLTRCAFLGGHPLTGKESRGVENAEAGLFKAKPYLLTPGSPEILQTAATAEFRDWIRQIGANEIVIGAEEHDRLVAWSSHLPQLAATALAASLADEEILAGPGLISATRLALSPYEIWRDILATNTEAISEALAHYIQQLDYLRENLRTRTMEQEFKRAAQFAGTIRQGVRTLD